ncbi:hypothetical protein M404DRAFT_239869 [Pisolithus tinctorius Marx 270]|uniref:Uncharacterized protein n=1 Tax=Pisolithus tinctorius Marx 270 TaxID=870435 RepID=A0A0C3NLV0_PISTI|nr:hypothetical protein M404DRAFT_239869 [Pisolithus tinctorius Marx 270]
MQTFQRQGRRRVRFLRCQDTAELRLNGEATSMVKESSLVLVMEDDMMRNTDSTYLLVSTKRILRQKATNSVPGCMANTRQS